MQYDNSNGLRYKITLDLTIAIVVTIALQALTMNNFVFAARTLNGFIYDTIAVNASRASIYSYLNLFMFIFLTLYLARDARGIRSTFLSLTSYKEKLTDLKNMASGKIRIEHDSSDKSVDIRKEIKDVESIIARRYKLAKIETAVSILTSLYFVGLVSLTVIMPCYWRASFDLDIKKIKPYCLESTIDEYEARWVSMKNYDDYLSLSKMIESKLELAQKLIQIPPFLHN